MIDEEKLEVFLIKYVEKLSQIQSMGCKHPYSDYWAGAEDVCNDIIDDLEEVLN